MHACMYATVTGCYDSRQLLPFPSKISCHADHAEIQDVNELHTVMLGKNAGRNVMFWLQIDWLQIVLIVLSLICHQLVSSVVAPEAH